MATGNEEAVKKFDENNEMYALPGTDGCDFIHNETSEPLKHASFYTQEMHDLREQALRGDTQSLSEYNKLFNNLISLI